MAGLNYGNSYRQRNKIPVKPGGVPKRPVKATDANTGELVGEYESIKACAGALGVPERNIQTACAKNRGSSEEMRVYKKKNLIFQYNEPPVF